jgi:hypothetical protein
MSGRCGGSCLLGLITALVLAAGATAKPPPPIEHVFVIVFENKNYATTFGPDPGSPYLARHLARQGALLPRYYATGHHSLGNYITMISGQSENPQTQADCTIFSEFAYGGIDGNGQALGSGCVYPPQVPTIADQLEAAGLEWRGYMQDMGNDPKRASATCGHPPIGAHDTASIARPLDQYVTRHNPFVYFHSVIDDQASCDAHVVALKELRDDLRTRGATPNYAFITPDLCADGHDEICADPSQPGGYAGINRFLRTWAPRILRSPAMRRDGLLIITFDESEFGARACCFVPHGPNVGLQGIHGPGGGRTGTVMISKWIKPQTVARRPYNHYSLLRSTEDIFGLGHLGYSAQAGVESFGADVYTRR